MRAVVFSEQGASEVLRVIDKEVCDPGPGEVCVAVARSAVNPTDWKFRAGVTAPGKLPQELVPNVDGAGLVDAVGAEVDEFSVGDRVWMMLAQASHPIGTAQEKVVAPAARVFPLPHVAHFDVGAALGVPALTAHRALTTSERGPQTLAPGSMDGLTVLVAGGAGAVGNAAIQLASWAGAEVISTVSSDTKTRLAHAAGATHVVNYLTARDVAGEIRDYASGGVDVIVEVAPAQNMELDLQVIRPKGTVAIYANNGGEDLTVNVRETFSSNARFQWVRMPTLGEATLRIAGMEVSAIVAAEGFGVGERHGLPLHHYPLERTGDAHDAVEAGAVGKVLIDVNELGEC